MSDHHDALPEGARVREYRIVRVLGRGGFGITYLAFDLNLDGPVALKEYFPAGYARRLADGSVGPASPDSQAVFDWGLKSFVTEAQAIHRLRHPNVVRAHRYFEARGGAFIVMEYVEGDSLAKILKDRPGLTFAEWRPLLEKLLDGLEHVHDHDYLHRDLKPGNIVVRDTDGAPVLIDFGSARIATGERTNTQMVTDGYAPIEQYGKGKQGPPADLYALAAVSYRALLGKRPPIAPDRVTNDTIARLEQRVKGAEPGWLAALDRCLALQPKDRPQSVAALREEFRKEPAATESPVLTDYIKRFKPAKSGRGMTLVEPLSSPFDAWEVRRWVGRRSSAALWAVVFAPAYRHRRPRDGERVRVVVDGKGSVRVWDPTKADDTPLWEKEFKNEEAAFAGLLEQEVRIQKRARRRIKDDSVFQVHGPPQQWNPKPTPPPGPRPPVVTPPTQPPKPDPTPRDNNIRDGCLAALMVYGGFVVVAGLVQQCSR